MKISSHTLGCKVNLYETEAVMNDFIDHGFIVADFSDACDVYLINTCTVTQTSDAKSRKMIRQAIRRNPDAVIAVMGCYSQLHPNQVADLAGVDIIIGTDNRHNLFDLVEETLRTKKRRIWIDDILNVDSFEELRVRRFHKHTRGFIKIQDGCENFCSYCAIPFARGKVRSRKPENVISEVRQLVEGGIKEIILSGINTGAYGQDFDDYDLADLLEELIASNPHLPRIRISSIELMEMSDKLIDCIRRNMQHFAHHLHIPLQGGSDNTLKRMNRKYTISQYRENIEKIRTLLPGFAVTTDCLAGFVGETEDDFLSSVAFIESMRFSEMHVFPYSRRSKTAADKMPGHLKDEIRTDRARILSETSRTMAMEYRTKKVGTIAEVLVETHKEGISYGRSSDYLEIGFPSEGNLDNQIVSVKITKAGYPLSHGEMIGKELEK